MQVPDRWWDKFKDNELEMHNRDPKKENIGHIRAALAMCENIDWNVGRLLKKLDELQIADDTIVVYFCDNGPNGVRWNGDMKGRKGSTDEGGVRSPLLIRWPPRIGAGFEFTHIAAAIDLLPTLAELAGIPVASRKPLDGTSLVLPLMGIELEPWPDRLIFSSWRDRVSVRNQRFRLDTQGKLFELQSDPGHRKDIASKHPQEAERLRKAVADWKQDVKSELKPGDRPFLLGHPDYRYTQIPARDGTAHGKIQRSNRFPNNSYFTNWTSLDDRITWPVQVNASGDYEVEIYYSCAKHDVGSTIELSLGNSRLVGQVSKAHDPPIRGAEHDRVKRQESYVKEFQPMSLGTIHLEKGRGELTLRATEIPGSSVMDFRLMMFTKKRLQ
jgi:hypothetical protein